MKKRFMKKAFTFAEILVVLGIIGVIAAATIPGLNNYAKNKQYRTKVFKTYGALGDATNMLLQEYRSTAYFPSDLHSAYAQYLNIEKICDGTTIKGCNTTDKIKMASGKDDSSYGDNGILLTDGTSLIISRGYGAVDHYGITDDDKNNTFATIQIDANGAQPPNKWGTDRWLALIVNDKGIVASGSAQETYGEDGGCKKMYGCLADIVKNK